MQGVLYKNLYESWPVDIFKYNSINIHLYKRPLIRQFWEMSIRPLSPEEGARAKRSIYLDAGLRIDNFENFIHQKSTNELLGTLIKHTSYELNDLEILFLKDTKIKTYNKNRLLLEILYPQSIPNIIRRELRIEDKISDIIDSHPEVTYFYLLYLNEFILGLDVLDTNIQKTAIYSMMSDNRLNLEETKEFTNVKIFAFARKK